MEPRAGRNEKEALRVRGGELQPAIVSLLFLVGAGDGDPVLLSTRQLQASASRWEKMLLAAAAAGGIEWGFAMKDYTTARLLCVVYLRGNASRTVGVDAFKESLIASVIR